MNHIIARETIYLPRSTHEYELELDDEKLKITCNQRVLTISNDDVKNFIQQVKDRWDKICDTDEGDSWDAYEFDIYPSNLVMCKCDESVFGLISNFNSRIEFDSETWEEIAYFVNNNM